MKNFPEYSASVSDDEAVCENRGAKLPDVAASGQPEPFAGKQAKKLSWGRILLLLCLIAAIGSTYYFYTQMYYYQQQVSRYNRQYSQESQARRETEESLETINEELLQLQEELEAAYAELVDTQQKNADRQQEIIARAEAAERELDALLGKLNSSYGFGSRDYYAERGVVVLSKTGGAKTVGIISNLNTTIYFSRSDKGISCEWGSFKDGRCPITIKPVSEGYHTITFTNKKNSDSFKILVIVTDTNSQ